VSGWGMTESGAVTTAKLDDPPEKVFHTDGTPLSGMEIRVTDAENHPMPVGVEGQLQVRGRGNFVGYLKRPQYFATDDAGWFDTGDLARIDDDNYVRITGRLKDVLIRGGENIPVVEIEQILYRHPSIQSVSIVGMPDARLGERACAFVVLKPAASLTLADIIAFLSERNVAKNYFPERLEIVNELPSTPSGKIQKFLLREMITRSGTA
jgi:cyclohexanecarboxylate-CoA ligase